MNAMVTYFYFYSGPYTVTKTTPLKSMELIFSPKMSAKLENIAQHAALFFSTTVMETQWTRLLFLVFCFYDGESAQMWT